MSNRGQIVTFGTALAYVKGWPTGKVTVRVDGVELCRKDGAPRKFDTKEAAQKAALVEIKKANGRSSASISTPCQIEGGTANG
jgi:hypothetical protein